MKEINIAFVSDENYSKYMLVTIASIINNYDQTYKINFYVLDTGITISMKKFIFQKLSSQKNIDIEFIKINTEKIDTFKTKTHVSISAFAKIYIAQLIDKERVIYLDCDLIINHNIIDLWNQFEEDIPLQAVWNPFYNYDNNYIGLGPNDKTFNSGVMLLNLGLLRTQNASNDLIDFLEKYNDKTKLHDQAAFNAVFKNDWEELEYKWNYQASMILSSYKELGISKEEYFDLYDNPSIIHFTSNSKPWQLRNAHPYKEKYLQYYSAIFNESQETRNYFIDLLKYFKGKIRYKKSIVQNHVL